MLPIFPTQQERVGVREIEPRAVVVRVARERSLRVAEHLAQDRPRGAWKTCRSRPARVCEAARTTTTRVVGAHA